MQVCGINMRPSTLRILAELLLTCQRCAKSHQEHMRISDIYIVVYLILRLVRNLGYHH